MNAQQKAYPANWQVASDFDPNDHMMNLKGKDYLNVQNRLVWFIRDQRALIVADLDETSYIVRTEQIELDRQAGYACFKTYVRDVLGNEATMYGSESAKDFGDYAEKASTKSLGRALAVLGYGTQFAPEMDEGERVVDSPVERKQPKARQTNAVPPVRSEAPEVESEPEPINPDDEPELVWTIKDAPLSQMQKREFDRLTHWLKRDLTPDEIPVTALQADDILQSLRKEWADELERRRAADQQVAQARHAKQVAHNSLEELPVGAKGQRS